MITMDLFGTLGPDSCLFFYFIAVFTFAFAVVTLFAGIFSGKPWLSIILAVGAPFVTYYMYRILFSMCKRSL